jgi:hypothetical protein
MTLFRILNHVEPARSVRSMHFRCRSNSGCRDRRIPFLAEERAQRGGVAEAEFDPMYGPAVRRKRVQRCGGGGLASMYPAFS